MNEELEEFHAQFRDAMRFRKKLVNDWGYPFARMSLMTGIVLSREVMDEVHNDHQLFQHLFKLQAYRNYVMECAYFLAHSAKGGRALEALDIVNRCIGSRALASTCKYLRLKFIRYRKR